MPWCTNASHWVLSVETAALYHLLPPTKSETSECCDKSCLETLESDNAVLISLRPTDYRGAKGCT